MEKINWNRGWQFAKPGEPWAEVDLPHTWNGHDGQDGGDDYFRGSCQYRKTLRRDALPPCAAVYLELEGANSTAEVRVNGQLAARHEGGYSTWRAELTALLQEENEILVTVSNAPNDHVYPQKADFTFYGGLYRTVSLLCAGAKRFDLDYYGTPGLKITPQVTGQDAAVTAEAFLTGTDGGETLLWQIWDGETLVARRQTSAAKTEVTLAIPQVHLWNGRSDPHLYRLTVELIEADGTALDARSAAFGCRTVAVDAERGFLLNGRPYPLRGVSRHQDRPGVGSAIAPADHEEDMALICELGANSIRLAHYQHDPYFYDLCDRYGMVVWAEIPYISRHLPKGRENTLQQMRELIVQNYNHPCIAVWGLSNEITMEGAADEDLLENHRVLNELCHRLDPTRFTTEAVVTMCSPDDPYVHIPDAVAYNHYYGWYGGTTEMNGEFLDEFHRKYPDTPIGLSEYGCEALDWHSSQPQQGDYTEEYQAHYHEAMIRQLRTRPFVWCSYVWNMFDFGADARSEGGEDGMNHKGLVTFDRKYKKDAFYAYKAWLSAEPFVHLCGKRYTDRVEAVTRVTVYSNQPEVALYANGQLVAAQKSEDHFFYFQVPNEGETVLTARAGACTDESRLRRVAAFNERYRMKESGDVLNWFEITAPEGRFSINDRIGEIVARPGGALRFRLILLGVLARHRGELKAKKGGGGRRGTPAEMKQFVAGFTVRRAISMAGMSLGITIGREETLRINQKLNRIKK